MDILKFTILGSCVIHLIVLTFLQPETKQNFQKIKLIVKTPPAQSIPQPEISPRKKKIKEKIIPTEKPIPKTPIAAPVFGADKSVITPGGGIAVPVGNTLLTEDDGKRLKPSEVKDFTGDLSHYATLIPATFQLPKYTDEAVDAALEGVFTVDVFVDEMGHVRDVELKKKIGYGMDQRVLDSMRKAEFSPRKNKFGKEIEGWTEVKLRLVIP